MVQSPILQKPTNRIFSTVTIIAFVLFIQAIYMYSQYESNTTDYFYYRAHTVYWFAGAYIVTYCLLLIAIHYWKLHQIIILIGTVVTLFYGNDLFYLLLPETAPITFTIVVGLLLACQFVRAKDASFAAILMCVFNLTIHTELSTTTSLGIHLVLASVIVLYALRQKWRITVRVFGMILALDLIIFILDFVIERNWLMLVVTILYSAIYLMTYRKLRVT